jgi:hypothetical protein
MTHRFLEWNDGSYLPMPREIGDAPLPDARYVKSESGSASIAYYY